MRAGGGKDKGSRYERDICTKLSLWISGGKDRDLFWRSAMSGGRATVARQKGLTGMARQAGDITATAPEGHVLTDHFYVECKRYDKLDFGAFLTKQKGVLAKFWDDTLMKAVHHGRIPMVICRENFSEDIVIVPNEALLERGRTGITFHFNPDALVARMMFLKADMYMLDGILAKPFHPPSRYQSYGDVETGPMLKPGELARILAGPVPPAKTLEDAALIEAAKRNGITIPGRQPRKRATRDEGIAHDAPFGRIDKPGPDKPAKKIVKRGRRVGAPKKTVKKKAKKR